MGLCHRILSPQKLEWKKTAIWRAIMHAFFWTVIGVCAQRVCPNRWSKRCYATKDLNESRDPGMGHDILRWSSPVIFEKPTLWRRQQEIRSAKAGIDTSCLEIGTTAFR